MDDTSRLQLLLWATVLKCLAGAGALSDQYSATLLLECGPSPDSSANISQAVGRHTGGFYTMGRRLQCHSRMQKKGSIYAHVISDVFGRDCGAEVSEDGVYSITVYMKPHKDNYLPAKEQMAHRLSCHYDRPLPRVSHPPRAHENHRTTRTSLVTASNPHLIIKTHISTASPAHDVKEMSLVQQDGTLPPVPVSNEYPGTEEMVAMLPSRSVLQLNLIDENGGMTTVVFPGKRVALELQSGHHSTLGMPMVTSCRVTNPLPDADHHDGNNVFSATILQHGCGLGKILPSTRGFMEGDQGLSTPYFSVPALWTTQPALLFSCDVIICADVNHCGQTCPAHGQKAFTPGIHDIAILLESQVVTSCPSVDDMDNAPHMGWDQSLFPDCPRSGHSLHQPVMPPEADQNMTGGATESGVNKHLFVSNRMASQLHYILIISLLGLLILIFMIATFYKMLAMQRQLVRSNKAAREARERISTEQREQTTQTPRPLPRTPNGRSHTLNRHTRQGGDGASMTVLHLDDTPASGSRPPSGVPPPYFDNRRDSVHSNPPASPQQRQPRPQPYDVPPSHDQQQDFVSSRNSVPPSSPFLFESPQPSPEMQSFQTVEEKNPERHTTIIEIKKPCSPRDSAETSAWKPQEHLTSFTGNNPTNGSNTLERGVVLGINSLRRHMDRENQVSGQARDRRPITAQHHEPLSAARPVTAQVYYTTPAPCSEDSSLKELLLKSSADGGVPTLGGIRTSPHRGSRKGVTPVTINTVEETTRL